MEYDLAKEVFKDFLELRKGDMTFDIGGNSIKIVYSGGFLSLNQTYDVGRAELILEDIVAEQSLEDDSFLGPMGSIIVKFLQKPDFKAEIMKKFGLNKINIFYSKTEDNKHVITIPVAYTSGSGNPVEYGDFIVGRYPLLGPDGKFSEPYSPDSVYNIHARMCKGKTLQTSEELMKIETGLIFIRTVDIYSRYHQDVDIRLTNLASQPVEKQKRSRRRNSRT